MANITIHINTDIQDEPLGSSGVEFTEISTANDFLVITNGSDTVADGEAIPSSHQLSSAAPVIDGTNIVVPKYMLADISDAVLKESTLMGQKNYRYVLALDFDDETTSEPVLELWDDSDMDTVDLTCLGAGTASSSWFHGITTTDALPGALWTGSRLAGSSDGHFLWLNNEAGALTEAKTLYCNLYMEIPSTQTNGGHEEPIMVVKYASA